MRSRSRRSAFAVVACLLALSSLAADEPGQEGVEAESGSQFASETETESVSECFYASRLPGEPEEGVEDVHFHPVEKPSVRLSASWRL